MLKKGEKMSQDSKRYLGDGVYVAIDQFGQVHLSTEGNDIFLECEVIQELLKFFTEQGLNQ
jgi:hypothetical protein